MHYKTGVTYYEHKLADFRLRHSFWQEITRIYSELIWNSTKLKNLRWDNNFELSQIANMDETSLFMNIPNTKTIAKISSK